MFFCNLAPCRQRRRRAADWSSPSRSVLINLQPAACGALIKAEPPCIFSFFFFFPPLKYKQGHPSTHQHPPASPHAPPNHLTDEEGTGDGQQGAKEIANQQKRKAFPNSSPISVFEPQGEAAICIPGGGGWRVVDQQRKASHSRFQSGLIRTAPSGRGGAA